ncbi:MAG TPA: THUMP domain-containing protein [Nitrososphaerales archaeon]|nr:THUMP domain-containing protein [Nitrososphaerales archaeon]
MFVLSGEELSLPFAEIRALAGAYSSRSKIELLGKRTAICSISDEDIVSKISERAAYSRFGGLLVSRSESFMSLPGTLDVKLEGKSFAVDSLSIRREDYGELGGAIKEKTGASVSLENPDYVFQSERLGSEYLLAFSTRGRKTQSWRSRRPRARKFFLPSAIYPKLARALVNLSRAKEGEVFLDPFCGTGSLLIESQMMGIHSIGFDLTRWIARGALINMKQFSLESSILRADSTGTIPLKQVDAVATDVPYGRASSTKGRTTQEIIEGFLSSIGGVMPSKAHCVVMHPSSTRAESNSFQLVEEHSIYVHRNLTRVISILERK